MKYNNYSVFSTYDRDQDLSSTRNCASIEGGGWWYKHGACSLTFLNSSWGKRVWWLMRDPDEMEFQRIDSDKQKFPNQIVMMVGKKQK